MKKKIISIGLMAASIVLMALPYGVRMNWGVYSDGAIVTSPTYESYFSRLPIGYANWFPILTAVLSIAIVILIFAGLKKTTIICLLICVIASLASAFLFDAGSVVGAVVLALHAAVLVIQSVRPRPRA